LERFIQDDIERHGNRLGEFEEQLVGMYNDTVGYMADNAQGNIEDGEEGLFEEDDDGGGCAPARSVF
jgi:hypothetical protein